MATTDIFATPASYTQPYTDRFGRVLLHESVNRWGWFRGFMTFSALPHTWQRKTTDLNLVAIRWEYPLKGLVWRA